ncbi:hypothetical protein [Minwuia sp.]|uniref:hypothetical protein n=1 Tax=Minwuia sp. TaxID=2493630 RepID=UPI003A93B61A
MRKLHRDPPGPSGNDPSTHATADVAKTRSCLRCAEKFESSGFGERICRRCKSSTTWRNGNTGASSRR